MTTNTKLSSPLSTGIGGTQPPRIKGSMLSETLKNRLRGKQVNRLEMITSLRTYGDVVQFALTPGLKAYALFSPDAIKYVLVDAADKFQKGPALKKQAADALGQGLLLSEGEFHKRQRKLAQPAFHHARIMGYGQVMVDYTERTMNAWRDGQTLDIHESMMRLTMEIVARTLFDADVSGDAGEIGEAMTDGIRAINSRIVNPFQPPKWVPTRANRRAKHAQEVLTRTVMRFIEDRRRSGTDNGDLLSMLMMTIDETDGTSMTDKQIYDEVRTLFAAGHETTANALAWTWLLIGQNPDTARKLHAELDTVLAGRAPTLQDLPALPYTEQIIKEALRLYPPAWIMNRQACEDVTIGGYPIQKGSLVFISPYAMHHDPRYFDAPETFKPERWTPDFEKTLPKYAYFPFGGGPRVCIGNQFALMEARLVLAAVAQRWTLDILPDQQIEMEPLITLRAKNGIQVRVKART